MPLVHQAASAEVLEPSDGTAGAVVNHNECYFGYRSTASGPLERGGKHGVQIHEPVQRINIQPKLGGGDLAVIVRQYKTSHESF